MLIASIAIFVLLIDKHDLVTGLGAVALMAAALGRAGFNRFLLWPPFAFLGRISYSLYLTHMLVIATLLQLLPAKIGVPFIAAASLILSHIVATVFHICIERPSIRLGQKLSR